MHICHDSLFYGVLLLDNPVTSPHIFLRRLALIVLALGAAIAAVCFVGGCGAATECVCFIVCVRSTLSLPLSLCPGQLSFLSSAGQEMSTNQTAVAITSSSVSYF